MAESSALEVLEQEKGSAKEQYQEWDFNRPPFCYEAKEPAFEAADESRIFEIEARVFRLAEHNHYLKPPEGLKEDHPIYKAHENFLEASDKFCKTIDAINQKLKATPPEKPSSDERSEHYLSKKKYFEAAFTYFLVLQRTHGQGAEGNELFTSEKRRMAKQYADEVETIYLAHQTYAGVRSAVDKNKPIRDSGDIVMNHAYEVCVATINHFLEKIDAAKSEEEKAKLYHRLKVNLIVALTHDLVEDHRHVHAFDLFGGVMKLSGFEFNGINLAAHPALPRLARAMHFDREHFNEIVNKVSALTKPEAKKEQEGYLHKQILENEDLSKEEKMDVVLIKLFDRLSNIKSLKYMREKPGKESKVARQVRKLNETLELLNIAEKVISETDDTSLRPVMLTLTKACMDEAKALEDDPERGLQEVIDVDERLGLIASIEAFRSSIKKVVG